MNTVPYKKILLAAAGCFAIMSAGQSQAQNVGVSVQFGQPGFYGHIDIGNFPQPQVIYNEPVIVQRGAVVQPPLYLIVPPGHRNKWEKHCHEYNACSRQVYFVDEGWYNTQVVPRYRNGYRHEHDDDDRDDHGRGRGHEHEHGHGHDRD